MKKVLILTVAVFVVMSAVVIAASKDYYQQYRAPMYGTYRPANNYAQRPPMYGNKPPMMYGQMPPPPPYGNMQPQKHYGNLPYGNHRPPMMYGQRPPIAYGNNLQCMAIVPHNNQLKIKNIILRLWSCLMKADP